jgi:hypothetical protein
MRGEAVRHEKGGTRGAEQSSRNEKEGGGRERKREREGQGQQEERTIIIPGSR